MRSGARKNNSNTQNTLLATHDTNADKKGQEGGQLVKRNASERQTLNDSFSVAGGTSVSRTKLKSTSVCGMNRTNTTRMTQNHRLSGQNARQQVSCDNFSIRDDSPNKHSSKPAYGLSENVGCSTELTKISIKRQLSETNLW